MTDAVAALAFTSSGAPRPQVPDYRLLGLLPPTISLRFTEMPRGCVFVDGPEDVILSGNGSFAAPLCGRGGPIGGRAAPCHDMLRSQMTQTTLV
jgi:hypothetical protein